MSAIETRVPAGAGRFRITPESALRSAAVLWYVVAAFGQLGFLYFIAAFYGTRTLSGRFEAWNDKPLIDGYIVGDGVGNAMFAIHALGAAVITLGGLLQLVPCIRRHAPAFHRWSGRTFVFVAYLLALGGLWLTWGRGTYLSPISAFAISVDAVLIVVFVTLAWRHALAGRYAVHRRWALRAFMAANAVWFLRIGIMAWVILNQGAVGMTENLSGPVDIVLIFGCYLIPLAVLELYLRAQTSRRAVMQWLASAVVLAMTGVTALGVFGTLMFMWGPYL